jgi:hypothetical protein
LKDDALNETDVLLGLSVRSSSAVHAATKLDVAGKQKEAIAAYEKIIHAGSEQSEQVRFCYFVFSISPYFGDICSLHKCRKTIRYSLLIQCGLNRNFRIVSGAVRHSTKF